jgi:hypothetical protein
MQTVPLDTFLETMHAKFPNLKSYDETRLFSVLLEAGFEVEFNVTDEGGTSVTHADLTDEVAAKLSKL